MGGIAGSATFDIGGNITSASTNSGAITNTIPSSNNYAAPTQITTNSLTQNLSWTGFLGLASATGPNGESTAIGYDGAARPNVTQSPFGAQTAYGYNDGASPPTRIAYTNSRWVKSTLDGFGRAIRVEQADGSGTHSIVDTIYAPCGCSPLGRVHQVSMPYAPGATPVWTTYNYDGIGRTISVVKPDGSTTSYAYWQNLTYIVDAAGNWKEFVQDAFGNLTLVREPNPKVPADRNQDYWTYYGYDYLNHLTWVNMPRDGVTQARWFNYIDPVTHAPGAFLQSANNPENGIVQYGNNADGTVSVRIDANGNTTYYGYDRYQRLTIKQYLPAGRSEDMSARVTYYYDSNPYDPDNTFSTSPRGRLTAVLFGTDTAANKNVEWYGYTAGGQVSAKRLQVTRTTPDNGTGQSATETLNFDARFGYNNEGGLQSITYPTTYVLASPPGTNSPVDFTATPGPSYGYTFDPMGRPYGMTDDQNNVLVANSVYGAASELLSRVYSDGTETRTYNNLYQLTSVARTGQHGSSIGYRYPDGANIGKVSSIGNFADIQYKYDALNRLVSAAATGSPSQTWSEQYVYDGFGNLTQKIGANAPSLSVAVDANNHIVGYTYDANGNVKGAPIASQAYSYDYENRMTMSANASGLTFFAYDENNRRVGRTTYDSNNNSQETIYFNGPGWAAAGDLFAVLVLALHPSVAE